MPIEFQRIMDSLPADTVDGGKLSRLQENRLKSQICYSQGIWRASRQLRGTESGDSARLLRAVTSGVGASKYIVICVNQFTKFPNSQGTARTTAVVNKVFMENYIALRAIPRVIPTDQGLGFICKSLRGFWNLH